MTVRTHHTVTAPGPYAFSPVITLGTSEEARAWIREAGAEDLTGDLDRAHEIARELDVDVKLSTPQGFAAGRVWREVDLDLDDDETDGPAADGYAERRADVAEDGWTVLR